MADVNITIALAGLAAAQQELNNLGTVLKGLDDTTKPLSSTLTDFGARLDGLSGRVANVGAKASLIAAPFALAGKSLLASAGDFEASMIQVQTASGASAETMAKVSAMAKQFGADTTFSAGQIAGAFKELNQTGVSVQDALDGVMEGTVHLAAATKTDLATSANIAGSAMQMFGLEAKQVPAAIDNLYNATIQSKFGLQDMAAALSYAGRSAVPLHINFSDLNAALALTSTSFVNGSSAGTSMADFLQRLTPESKKAREAMEELGLMTEKGTSKFFDAKGQFIGFAGAAQLLQDSMKGLGDEEKLTFERIVFGAEGVATADKLARGGAAAFNLAAEGINHMGSAADAANAQMKGWNGALEQLSGAWENIGNALLDSGFVGFLTDAANEFADFVAELAKSDPVVLNMVAGFGLLATAVGPVLLAISAAIGLFGGIVTALGAILSPIGLVVAAVVGLGVVLYETRDKWLGGFQEMIAGVTDWWNKVTAGFSAVTDGLAAAWSAWDGTFSGFAQTLANSLQIVGEWAGNLIASVAKAAIDAGAALIGNMSAWDIGEAIGRTIATVGRWAGDFLDAVAKAAADAGGRLTEGVSAWDIGAGLLRILEAIGHWVVDFQAKVFDVAIQAGEGLIKGMTGWDVTAPLNAIIERIKAWANDLAGTVSQAATDAGKAVVGKITSWGVPDALKKATDAIPGIWGSMTAKLGNLAAPLKDAMVQPFAAAADELYVHSIVPDMRAAIVGEFEKMLAGISKTTSRITHEAVELPFAAASKKIVELTKQVSDQIQNSDLSGPQKIDAFAQVAADLEKMGDKGAIALKNLRTNVTTVSRQIASEIQGSDWGVQEKMDAFTALGDALDDAGKTGTDGLISLSKTVTSTTKEIAQDISGQDWGIGQKIAAFDQLGDSLHAMGSVGTDALAALDKEISNTAAQAASDQIDGIFNQAGVSAREMLVQVTNLSPTYQRMGSVGTKALTDILQAQQKLNQDIAESEIGDIYNDQTLTLQEQAKALSTLAAKYTAEGAAGARAMTSITPQIQKVNTALAQQNSVLYGVTASLTRTINEWGGWGAAAGRIVDSFSQNAESTLTDFFETGQLDLKQFGANMKRTFANEAAKWVVQFAEQGIRAIIQWGTSMLFGTGEATAGMTAATTAGVALSTVLWWLVAIALVITAAYLLFKKAGLELGDTFEWLKGVFSGFIKILGTILLPLVTAIFSIFKALGEVLEKVAGWVKTIGDTLGKGDLKDLIKLFSKGAGDLFSGFFKGFGNIFKGIFEEGGWVAGKGAVPIIAHEGEFVVNAADARQYAPLLEAINGGGNPMAALGNGLAADSGAEVMLRPSVLQAAPSTAPAAAPAVAATAVHLNGPIISSDMTVGQFARRLGARMDVENSRKRGRKF